MSDEVKNIWTLRFEGLDRYLRPNDKVRDKFHIESFSHGVSSDQYTPGQRSVHLQDVNLVRKADSLTPILMRLCQTGDKLTKAIVELRAEKDGKEIYRMVYELLNAGVSYLHPGGSAYSPDHTLTESLGLSFEKLRVNVKEAELQGSAELMPQANTP